VKPTILLDMDGVLVHNNQRFLDLLNKKFGTSYAKTDIKDFHYSCFSYNQRSYLYSLWNGPDIYDDAELGQKEMKVIEKLRSLGRVVACTAPLEGHIQGKYRWLRKHFDKMDIIIAHDKTMVRGDFLVDDAIHNLDVFPGTPICYTQPWNLDWQGYRVDSFQEIPSAITHHLKATP